MLVTRCLVVGRTRGLVWFRLFGVGLSWTDHRQHRPLLSERYAGRHGFRKKRRLHVGPHCFLVTTGRRP
jgi:hypothetical protein